MFFRFLLKIDDEIPDQVRNEAGIFSCDWIYLIPVFQPNMMRPWIKFRMT